VRNLAPARKKKEKEGRLPKAKADGIRAFESEATGVELSRIGSKAAAYICCRTVTSQW
jgi:hypothetical protein